MRMYPAIAVEKAVKRQEIILRANAWEDQPGLGGRSIGDERPAAEIFISYSLSARHGGEARGLIERAVA